MTASLSPLACELQQMADQIKESDLPAVKRAEPAPARVSYISSAYNTCSLCGDTDHRDGACYSGGL